MLRGGESPQRLLVVLEAIDLPRSHAEGNLRFSRVGVKFDGTGCFAQCIVAIGALFHGLGKRDAEIGRVRIGAQDVFLEFRCVGGFARRELRA